MRFFFRLNNPFFVISLFISRLNFLLPIGDWSIFSWIVLRARVVFGEVLIDCAGVAASLDCMHPMSILSSRRSLEWILVLSSFPSGAFSTGADDFVSLPPFFFFVASRYGSCLWGHVSLRFSGCFLSISP